MNTQIRQYIENLKTIETYEQSLQEIQKALSKNDRAVNIQFGGKFVADDLDEGMVYKIETPIYAKLRLKLIEEAANRGLGDLFLSETQFDQGNRFIATKQPIIDEWHYTQIDPEKRPPVDLYMDNTEGQLSYRIFQDYPEKYNDFNAFLEEFEVAGIARENCGIQNEKIKIFDWFGNYWIDTDGNLLPPTKPELEE